MMHNFWAKIDLLCDLVYEYVENKTTYHNNTFNNVVELKIENTHKQILECIPEMTLNDKMWIKEDLKNHNFNSNISKNNTAFNYMLNFFDLYDKEL